MSWRPRPPRLLGRRLARLALAFIVSCPLLLVFGSHVGAQARDPHAAGGHDGSHDATLHVLPGPARPTTAATAPSATAAPAPAAGAPASPTTAPGERAGGHGGKAHRHDRAAHGGAGTAGSSTTGAVTGAVTPASTGTATPASRRHGRERDARKDPKGHHLPGGAATPVVSAPAASAPAVAPPAARAASTPAVAAVAASSAPAQVKSSHAQPARAGGRAHGHRSKRTSARSRGSSAGGPLAAGVTPAAALGAQPQGGSPGAGRAASGARHGHPARRSASPIVTTVTRIINVVPLALRIAFAALAALAVLLAASSRLASRRAGRLARQRRELLADVGLLQAALLPELAPRIGPVAVSAAYRPASGPAAGGDFYDVFALEDGRIGVIVGDVSGHGRGALPHTALLRFTLRAYLEAGLSPRGALHAAGPALERQLGESLATVVVASYDPDERTLVYSSAGHHPPIVLGAEPLVPAGGCAAPPIGVGLPTGTRQTVVRIPGEAVVCFYTDGIVESRVRGSLFGAERLRGLLEELGPDAGAGELLDGVDEETDARPDDMAACILRIAGQAVPPKIVLEELEVDRRELDRGRPERFIRAAGVPADGAREILSAARGAIARDGRAVLEMRLGEGAPDIALRDQNLDMFRVSAGEFPRDRQMAV